MGWTQDYWFGLERGERAMWVANIYGGNAAARMKQYDDAEDQKQDAKKNGR